jgi:hypothetical protein
MPMWVIQGDVLVSLPDGAPVPPGSKRIEPPAGFHDDPRGYGVKNGELVEMKRPERKAAARSKRGDAAQLTPDEIAKIRAAIKAGKI